MYVVYWRGWFIYLVLLLLVLLVEYSDKSYFSEEKKKKGRPLGGVGKDTHLYFLISGQVKLTHNYWPRASKTAGKLLNRYQGSQCLVLTLPKYLVLRKQALCVRTANRWGGSWRLFLDSMGPLERAREETCLVWWASKKSETWANCGLPTGSRLSFQRPLW